MKREKKLTKRERKEISGGPRASGKPVAASQHIHCIACGRHLDPAEFTAPASAKYIRCQHGSTFPSCVDCAERSRALLAEHDRTGESVKIANAWH